jgi:translation initiation factor IF-1
MSKEEGVQVEGQVVAALVAAHFRVRLDDGRQVVAYLGGNLRVRRCRIVLGDRVTVELSVYDPSAGRIIAREDGLQGMPAR